MIKSIKFRKIWGVVLVCEVEGHQYSLASCLSLMLSKSNLGLASPGCYYHIKITRNTN